MVTRAEKDVPLAREIEHTADAGFEVEAPTLAGLFERAGLALLGLMADLTTVEAREHTRLEIQGDGVTDLLRDFLSALLVRVEVEGFLARELDVADVDEHRVAARAAGERIDPARHHLYGGVKAVTYHQLAVHRTAHGWWARVIVDV